MKVINSLRKFNTALINPFKSLSRKTFTSTTMSGEEMVSLSRKHTVFSWSAQGKIDPIPIVKAKGCHFWDANGKKYFDMNSQLMCMNVGHGHPKVIQAIKDQAEELAFAGPAFATKIRAEVGPMLAKHTPADLNKFFFTLGGAEAIENAVKFAKFTTGRHKIITRNRAYHGSTHYAIMLTGDNRRWPNEAGAVGGIIRTLDPYSYRSQLFEEGMTDEQFTEKLLINLEELLMFENPESIAAFCLETITGTNGIIIPPKGYLPGIRKICDKYGIMMICDEVMAGWGRTGKWYACHHENIVPDILTMAKGLTSAYIPLGAVAVSDKIMDKYQDVPFKSGLTYQAHPMGLACVKAVINIMEEEKLCENSTNMGEVLKEIHRDLYKKHPCIGEVRSIGLFGGIELVKNRKTKEPMAPYGNTSEAMTKFSNYIRENGIWAFVNSHIIHNQPPLCVTEQELREGMAVIDKGLDIVDQYVI